MCMDEVTTLILSRRHIVNHFYIITTTLIFCQLASGIDPTNLSFHTIKFTIKENEPAGFIVGNLLEDLPVKRYFVSSKLTFTIQRQDCDCFEIKKDSSKLITSKSIDLESLCLRDCVDKIKQLLLIVIVWRDRQFLEEIRVFVSVEDVNDNDPFFKMPYFNKYVKEIIYGPGKRIELPRAVDKDVSAVNSAISYRLKENTSFFQLNVSKEGQPYLTIVRDLDAEVDDVHNLLLLAWNTFHVSDPTVTLTVAIFVEDINDNEPRFTQSIFKVPILETVELNHTIFQLKATDKDKTSKLQYLIMSGINDQIKGTFIVSNNGLISLIKRLDYETTRQYSISVGVTDGEFSSNARVEVIIIDVNDCPPQYSLNPPNLEVPENIAVGTYLGQMNIFDRDSSYVDKGIHCQEKTETQSLKFQLIDKINVRQLKVNIILRQKLDRDQTGGDVTSSVIICNDMGLHERLTSSFTIFLSVLDNNDNAPEFHSKDYVVRIKENMRPQYLLTQVSAVDKDVGFNSQINYYIPNLDFHDLFRIDRSSGEITVMNSLDREAADYYQIVVMATDLSVNETRLTSTATVHVHVIDVNDCIPKINASLTVFSIPENRPAGTLVGTLHASDGDIGLNGQFVFTIIPSAYSHYFELHTNGTILSKTSFDREKLTQLRFCLRITVRDLGEDNYLSSKTVVCISILDENDNAPQIHIIPDYIPSQNSTANYTFDFSILVSMTEPIGSPVLSFTCSDSDEEDNGRVSFSLEVLSREKKFNSLFQLNSTEKSVKLKRLWRKEDGTTFILTLFAIDNGQQPLQSSKVILIVFADIPPRFFDSTVTLASLSNTKINILIIVVLVTISSFLTLALVGAIICMIKPCGRKLFTTRHDLSRCESSNHTVATKTCPHSFLVHGDMMGSITNEDSELKGDVSSPQNEYCHSDLQWTNRVNNAACVVKYFTIPPQMPVSATPTAQEEQRSDSGRGASDEDNPTYLSHSDVFQTKPLYSVIPNIHYSSFVDVLNSSSSPPYFTMTNTNPVSFLSPDVTLSNSARDHVAVFSKCNATDRECDRKCIFVHSQKLPLHSDPYRQSYKIQEETKPFPTNSEVNIPLIAYDAHSSTTLPSSNFENRESFSSNLSQNVTVGDDIANLSSHIDQLFFISRPARLKSFGKNL